MQVTFGVAEKFAPSVPHVNRSVLVCELSYTSPAVSLHFTLQFWPAARVRLPSTHVFATTLAPRAEMLLTLHAVGGGGRGGGDEFG